MNNIEKMRKAFAEKKARGELKAFDPIEKAKNNPKSWRLAINAKCWDCQGGNKDPHPRWRIANCEIPDCSLYPLRPYQTLYLAPTPKSLQV